MCLFFGADGPYFLGIIRYRKHIIFFIWPNLYFSTGREKVLQLPYKSLAMPAPLFTKDPLPVMIH